MWHYTRTGNTMKSTSVHLLTPFFVLITAGCTELIGQPAHRAVTNPVNLPQDLAELPIVDRNGDPVTDGNRIIKVKKKLTQMLAAAQMKSGSFAIGYIPVRPGEDPLFCDAQYELHGSGGWTQSIKDSSNRWFVFRISKTSYPYNFSMLRWGTKPLQISLPYLEKGIVDLGEISAPVEDRTKTITATFVNLDDPSVKPAISSAWLRINGNSVRHQGRINEMSVTFPDVPHGSYLLEGALSNSYRVTGDASFIKSNDEVALSFTVPIVTKKTNDVFEFLLMVNGMENTFVHYTGAPGSLEALRNYKDKDGNFLRNENYLRELDQGIQVYGYQFSLQIQGNNWIASAEPLDHELKARLATSNLGDSVFITLDKSAELTLGKRFSSAWQKVSVNGQQDK